MSFNQSNPCGPNSINLSGFDTIAYVRPDCCKKSKRCGCNIIIFENVLTPTGTATGTANALVASPSFSVENFDPVPVNTFLAHTAHESSAPTDSWINALTGDVFKYTGSFWVKTANLKGSSPSGLSPSTSSSSDSDAFLAHTTIPQLISFPDFTVGFGAQGTFTNANFSGTSYTAPKDGKFGFNTQLEFFANSVGAGQVKIDYVVDNGFSQIVLASTHKTLNFVLNAAISQNLDSTSFSTSLSLVAGDKISVRVTAISSPVNAGLGVNSPNSFFSGNTL